LEKKIKMHTQLQEEISALENVSSFKSEEELNVMILPACLFFLPVQLQ